MGVFRAQFKDRKGRKQESPYWSFDVTDHLGARRRFSSECKDKRLAEGTERNVERLVEFRKQGEPLRADMAAWVETQSERFRKRLLEVGIIDATDHARGKTLTTHIDDFERSLGSGDNTTEHVNLVCHRLRAVVDGCGFAFYSDINAEKVKQYLAVRRNAKKKPIGRQTSNFYLASMKQFCRWMVENGRANVSPVVGLKRLNVAEDVRRERRELSEAELRKLLRTTKAGPVRFGMTGLARYRLYRLALATGLRASELASLTPMSFDLEARVPTVTVEAKASKRRTEDTLPIPGIANEVAEWIAGMPATDRLWPGPWAKHKYGGRFIQADLEAAGLKHADERGAVADFHALRHTCLSQLGRSGASPKTMQLFARHSTVELTIGRYGHASLHDMAGAARGLADLSGDLAEPGEEAVVCHGDSHTQDAPACVPMHGYAQSAAVA